ncbi:hypothetical protein pb186bvf_020375 [Paramecium bursaria]
MNKRSAIQYKYSSLQPLNNLIKLQNKIVNILMLTFKKLKYTIMNQKITNTKQAIKIYDLYIYRDPKHFDPHFQRGIYSKLNEQLKYYKNICCNLEKPLRIMNNAQKLILVIFNHISKKVLIYFIQVQILSNSLQNYKDAVIEHSKCIILNPDHFEQNYSKGTLQIFRKYQISFTRICKNLMKHQKFYDKCISLNSDHFQSLYSKCMNQQQVSIHLKPQIELI